MKGWLKTAGVVCAVVLGGYVISFVSRLPESNCSTKQVSEVPSPDHAYKATLQLKNCNMGESLFYSVEIEARSPPAKFAWRNRYELEDDEYPGHAPTVTWATNRRLEIVLKTLTLSGSVQVHTGDDLTVVRRYLPSAPNTFPNYAL